MLKGGRGLRSGPALRVVRDVLAVRRLVQRAAGRGGRVLLRVAGRNGAARVLLLIGDGGQVRVDGRLLPRGLRGVPGVSKLLSTGQTQMESRRNKSTRLAKRIESSSANPWTCCCGTKRVFDPLTEIL